MGYPRQEKLQMIKLSYIWTSLDTIHQPSPQVCGGTKIVPFNFYWYHNGQAHLQQCIINKNAKLMYEDIANFYLNNPMNRYEYMKLPLDIIPEEIIQKYNLRNLGHKRFVYM